MTKMNEKLRFGPAGMPTTMKGRRLPEGIEYVSKLGLEAFEVEFVQGVKMQLKLQRLRKRKTSFFHAMVRISSIAAPLSRKSRRPQKGIFTRLLKRPVCSERRLSFSIPDSTRARLLKLRETMR